MVRVRCEKSKLKRSKWQKVCRLSHCGRLSFEAPLHFIQPPSSSCRHAAAARDRSACSSRAKERLTAQQLQIRAAAIGRQQRPLQPSEIHALMQRSRSMCIPPEKVGECTEGACTDLFFFFFFWARLPSALIFFFFWVLFPLLLRPSFTGLRS